MPSPDPHILSLEAFPSPEAFSAAMELARGTGFDALLLPLGEGEDGAAIAPLAEQARAADIALYARLRVDLFAIDDPLIARHESAFAIRRQGARDAKPIDPRSPAAPAGQALARLRAEDAHDILIPAIADRLGDLIEAGLCGLIIDEPSTGGPSFWTRLLQQVRQRADAVVFIAATPGLEREKARAIAASGFDYILSSIGWWDLRARWLVEEQQELRHAAPLMAEIGADTLRRHTDSAAALRLLNIAAATGAGMLVPLELVERLAEQGDACREALGLARDAQHFQGEMRLLSSPDAPATALLRMEDGDARESERALLLLINPSSEAAARLSEEEVLTPAGAFYQRFRRLSGSGPSFAPLAPGEIRALVGQHSKPVTRRIAANRKSARAAAEAPRIIVEQLRPFVAGGYPVKRVVGELLSVEADIYADGHEQLAAELLWRARDDRKWQAVRMTAGPNDVWTADMPLDRLGSHEYSVEAWLDRFGGFRRDFAKKRDAGVLQPVDYQEGRALVAAAHQRSAAKLRDRLARCLEEIDAAGEGDPQADTLLSAELALLMDEADDRPFRTQATPVPVEAERLEARYSSWYELFPRSQVDDPKRHGTFDDVIRQLPRIRDMGFDTLYFPPIHPIGRKNMKGKNNSLDPAPDDVGSPYAIGSAEGGHDAIHPQLGSFEDFRRLIRAAHDHGLEIALDFAIQCSPDHPWLKEHPGWFDWRPDGTIKYAENPPKKYQDIVNVDFYTDASVPDLWIALRDIVLLWVREGVKVFRVDNPHTKPFPFWEWLIAEVRGQHPEVIFLAEAFTRPKIMYRLAKIGFSQSYTYFTWRNGKAELIDYLVELSTTAPREFFRPHFFVNTPDINPPYLQTSGRPGFQVRAVLAATLSGLFGVYSGFELCESAPLPDREEYLDSEKYEVRPRDYAAPGNIVADIALLNRLRRGHPALQTHLNTRFYNAWNDNVLYYGKPSSGGGEMILVAVNLDPHHAQEADFEVPLWEFGLPDHGAVDVEDLATGDRFAWTGKGQHIRLDPSRPYRLWRITPAGGTVHG